ncbi:hypothetical protein DS891_23850 [Pseudoalteromonas sp. JC28]|uniref:hypothetical protein n=1 Tax=Pseudoalteromonas sp. JC28 TaxID=2267617 RepID=UPI0015736B9C|nr:hypothetical protein [Pseudoalteromonas sp. JC28]NSY36523.1 hypothetical protein [Pseudoalteromonas sp. JC28]
MTPNKATFSAGVLSTAAIAGVTVLEKYNKIEAVWAELSFIAIPLIMSLIVWIINRILYRIEPYTDEQIKQRAKRKNTINEIKEELKECSCDEMRAVLNAQLKKQYENIK